MEDEVFQAEAAVWERKDTWGWTHLLCACDSISRQGYVTVIQRLMFVLVMLRKNCYISGGE
jgi:hypothetical protein